MAAAPRVLFRTGKKHAVRPSAFSRTRLVVGQKGHFSCHQFRDEESSESREFVTDPFLSPSWSDALPLFQFLSLTAALLFVPSAEETEAKKYQTSPSRSIVGTVAGGNRGSEIFLLRKWIPNKKPILRRRLRRHQSFILFPCYLLPMAQMLFGTNETSETI